MKIEAFRIRATGSFETLRKLCTGACQECYHTIVQLWNLSWFHRVSFSRSDTPTAWRIVQKFGALRARGSGEPAGEYLPPSTHRLFYLPGRVSANNTRPGTRPASISAQPLFTAFRKISEISKGFFNAALHCLR